MQSSAHRAKLSAGTGYPNRESVDAEVLQHEAQRITASDRRSTRCTRCSCHQASSRAHHRLFPNNQLVFALPSHPIEQSKWSGSALLRYLPRQSPDHRATMRSTARYELREVTEEVYYRGHGQSPDPV